MPQTKRRYFGEFLVSKGLITSEQLCEALVYQTEKIPSPLTIAFQGKLIPPEKILEVLKVQHEQKYDFTVACDSLGLLTKPVEDGIKQGEAKARISLGQILIELNRIDYPKLNSAFDEYIQETPNRSTQPNSATVGDQANSTVISLAIKKPSLVPEQSTTTVGMIEEEISAIKFGEINRDMAQEYLEVFNEEKKSEMELIFLRWEKEITPYAPNALAIEPSMRVLYREYHTLKGTSRFIGGVLTEYIVHRAEDLLSIVMNNLDQCQVDTMLRMSTINLRVLDCVWDIRKTLEATGEEKPFLEGETRKSQLATLVFDLKLMTEEMNSKFGKVDLDKIADSF